jgi:hypothetical protein
MTARAPAAVEEEVLAPPPPASTRCWRSTSAAGRRAVAEAPGGIVLRDVAKRYDADRPPVLEKISPAVAPRECGNVEFGLERVRPAAVTVEGRWKP